MTTLFLDKRNVCNVVLPCGQKYKFLAAVGLALPWIRYHLCACGKKHKFALWPDLQVTCDGTVLGSLNRAAVTTVPKHKYSTALKVGSHQ